MFGIPVNLIVYGLIAAAGAGAVGYVVHLRSENEDLTSENTKLVEGLRITKLSMQRSADTAAKVLKESDARLAQAERENRQADGQIARLTDLINDPKPSTCDAAVLAVQKAMP